MTTLIILAIPLLLNKSSLHSLSYTIFYSTIYIPFKSGGSQPSSSLAKSCRYILFGQRSSLLKDWISSSLNWACILPSNRVQALPYCLILDSLTHLFYRKINRNAGSKTRLTGSGSLILWVEMQVVQLLGKPIQHHLLNKNTPRLCESVILNNLVNWSF